MCSGSHFHCVPMGCAAGRRPASSSPCQTPGRTRRECLEINAAMRFPDHVMARDRQAMRRRTRVRVRSIRRPPAGVEARQLQVGATDAWGCCCGVRTGAGGPQSVGIFREMPLTRWRGTWCVLMKSASASLRAGSQTGRNMCNALMVSFRRCQAGRRRTRLCRVAGDPWHGRPAGIVRVWINRVGAGVLGRSRCRFRGAPIPR